MVFAMVLRDDQAHLGLTADVLSLPQRAQLRVPAPGHRALRVEAAFQADMSKIPNQTDFHSESDGAKF
jgi:hypothetical protein